MLADDRQGTTVAEVTAGLPPGVHIVAVRHGRTNKLPDPQIRLGAGDGLLLFGEPGALDQAREQLGRLEFGHRRQRSQRAGHREILRLASRADRRPDRPA